MTGVEPPVQSSGADRWNVVLGLAVITLAGVSALEWLENRNLGDRVSRLEASASEGVSATAPTLGSQDAEQQFTSLNASISIRDAAFLGDPAAPIAIVEFSDFECPFCARHFTATFKRIHERYIANSKIKYVFRHLPLQEVHPKAFLAAEVAECSRRQGLFWEVHDRFFTQQRLLRTIDIRQLALAAGLEPGRLDECLNGPAADRIRRDIADARALGIAGTPLFFIGRTTSDGEIAVTRSINGARGFEVFETVLESLMR